LPDGTDLNKLAYCVAMHETKDGLLGYGKDYNNVHGIKNGNTAPCKKIGINRMCIYADKEESYEAFKKIWVTWYKTFPNIKLANKYTSQDRAYNWLNNVTNCYNKI